MKKKFSRIWDGVCIVALLFVSSTALYAQEATVEAEIFKLLSSSACDQQALGRVVQRDR